MNIVVDLDLASLEVGDRVQLDIGGTMYDAEVIDLAERGGVWLRTRMYRVLVESDGRVAMVWKTPEFLRMLEENARAGDEAWDRVVAFSRGG